MENSKPHLLFLHSALGTAADLEPLMSIFRDRGYNTHAFTFSGHGKGAAEPTEFRIDLFARDLENYLQKHSLQNVVIIGHSMGGYVALYHKANFEDSPVQMIFTYGTKFNWSESAVLKELPMMNPEHVQDNFPQFAAQLQNKHGERWKQVLRSTAHMMQNLERLDGLTREDMADISIPVILILGDHDRMVTTEETQLTGSWLPHSKLKTISHSKHELERTNLREMADAIEAEII